MIWFKHPSAPKTNQVVGKLRDIPDGEGREFAFGEGRRKFSMVVVRRGRRAWAYVNDCAHMITELNYFRDHFVNDDKTLIMCAYHGALYRFEDGACVAGPCQGEYLQKIPIRLMKGNIVIDEYDQAEVPRGAIRYIQGGSIV